MLKPIRYRTGRYTKSRAWIVLFIWIICLFYVLFQGGKTSIMLFGMVTLLSIYLLIGQFGGARRAVGTRQLTSSGEHTELLHAGDQVHVQLGLQIPGLLPLPYVIVREVLKRHNGESWSFEESLVPNMRGSGNLVFLTPPLERGKYKFMETECISEDIFGLIEHKGTFNAYGSFRVLPRTVFIPYWQLYDQNSRLSGPQAALTRSRRETTQINGVRDYVYGDRLSRIHWNATAKTGQWKSKEFEHESLPKMILVLDATEEGYKSSEQFELAVSTAASLLEYGNRERLSMGLCTISDETKLFLPTDSQNERQKMIQHLVDLDYTGTSDLLPSIQDTIRTFPQGAFFVLISPLDNANVLESLRYAGTRGMTASHIRIEQRASQTQKSEWLSLLRARGIKGYAVSDLQELPSAMGGGGL
ncbi:DUF58 domain-containing protein [Paenibacillus sp. 453mf]|uniref:DUF58 domain-containing protein n=1 Tax=Paenibacillus sp. 453mf TaxID=1761874 RepID=UPI0008E4FD55|nr:DUF58 domain-containing protein [Paenibacillus sp. 453mf]SFS61815.1 Uncharacterized conserved protein, DUF58 family, contains vWF domain [Paenibacillus sp. 453mf]